MKSHEIWFAAEIARCEPIGENAGICGRKNFFWLLVSDHKFFLKSQQGRFLAPIESCKSLSNMELRSMYWGLMGVGAG
jgi:hypothetical protein